MAEKDLGVSGKVITGMGKREGNKIMSFILDCTVLVNIHSR